MFSFPHIETWCACCERTGVPITPVCGICADCWAKGPATRQAYWEPFPFRHPPADSKVCPFPPGTEGKIAWMKRRESEKIQLFSKADATSDGTLPGLIQPRERPEVFALPKMRLRGVERDGKHFRARPFWLHKKHKLGSFQDQDSAELVIRKFWVETLGIFFELGGRMGHYFRPEIVREPENADKYPDIAVQHPAKSGAKEADAAMKRDRLKILRPGKKVRKSAPAKVKPTPRPKYDKPLKGPEKVDQEEKPAFPRLWRVAG